MKENTTNTPDTRNWRFTGYDKNSKEVESFVIKDRTEWEASQEAMSFVENNQYLKIDDWSLMPDPTTQPEASTQVQPSLSEVYCDTCKEVTTHENGICIHPHTQVQKRGYQESLTGWRYSHEFMEVTRSRVGVIEGSKSICKISEFDKTEKEISIIGELIASAPQLKEQVKVLLQNEAKLLDQLAHTGKLLNKANAEKGELLEIIKLVQPLAKELGWDTAPNTFKNRAYDKIMAAINNTKDL